MNMSNSDPVPLSKKEDLPERKQSEFVEGWRFCECGAKLFLKDEEDEKCSGIIYVKCGHCKNRVQVNLAYRRA